MAGLPTRVLVVDDYEPWHRFYATALQKQSDLQIIARVSDGLEAVQQAQELQPDLILLDVGLPTLNGIEAALRIGGVSPASKILFVSENCSADIVAAALSNGAGGYVVKSDAASELLPAIKAVLEGKRFVSRSVTGQVPATSNTRTPLGRHPTDHNPYLRFAGSASVSEFLASIIAVPAADFVTLQLFDSTNGILRIVAQQGFQSEFLNYFDAVSDKKECGCGAAMKGQSRIVVTDVVTDPLFSNEPRGVLLRANVRSGQSTPLIDPVGKFFGMVSTYCTRPGSPSPDVLKHVDNLATSFLTKINA